MSDNLLTTQWSRVKEGLMNGLTDKQVAIVGNALESQREYMLKEGAAAGTTSTSDVANFRKIAMPIIRRVIPGTIATELVGVQNMNGPVDQVFSLRYQYSDAVTVPNKGTDNPFGAPNIRANDELFGNNPALSQFYSSGAGASHNQEDQAVGAGAITNSPGAINENAARNGWQSALAAHANTKFGPYPSGSKDGTGQQYAGSLYGGGGSFLEGSAGRKVKLEIVSQSVEARTRKLQAGWTIEAMQDLKRQHNINIESEMTSAISAEIVQEIDHEVITDLLAIAGTVGTMDFATPNAELHPTFLGDKYANIGIYIQFIANEIARKTRRGQANWIVVSPMVVSILQSASKSVFAPAVSGNFKGPNNSELVGTLNGQIKVYSYLWNQASAMGGGTTNDTILIGYKGGNGEQDAGYFYCPYVPLMSSGVVMNPTTMQPQMNLMTRYGKVAFTQTETSLGNSADYYGRLELRNFKLA